MLSILSDFCLCSKFFPLLRRSFDGTSGIIYFTATTLKDSDDA
jgi:hypothetical protein